MSNRGIGHMKYKNLEIKCKYKVKSRNGKKQHRPGKKDNNNNNNNNNNNSNRLYWKVNFTYYICP